MRALALVLIVIGMILFSDEAWMFGIPFGHFLPDLTPLFGTLTINGEHIHHWVLGVVLLILGLFLSGTDHTGEDKE